MKKVIFTLMVLLTSVNSFAQFERDTYYVNTSVTGLGLSYSGESKLNLGLDATGGLFIEDGWALVGEVGLDYNHKHIQDFSAGAGIRYYIYDNGIYVGAGGRFYHQHDANLSGESKNLNDIQAKVEVGYAFYVNHYITIEPAVYYCQSFKDQDFSKVGLKVGLGFYF